MGRWTGSDSGRRAVGGPSRVESPPGHGIRPQIKSKSHHSSPGPCETVLGDRPGPSFTRKVHTSKTLLGSQAWAMTLLKPSTGFGQTTRAEDASQLPRSMEFSLGNLTKSMRKSPSPWNRPFGWQSVTYTPEAALTLTLPVSPLSLVASAKPEKRA